MNVAEDEPEFRSVLVPERQSLLLHLGCSTFIHGGAIALMLLVTVAGGMCSGDEGPIIEDSIQVSVVSLPKSESNVPDRLQRAPRDAGQQPTPEPVKQKTPQNVSDLKVKTPDAEPDPGAEDAREQMLRELERQRMLDEMMNAPEGAVDRNATDPNGVEGAPATALGVGAQGDPEYARWYAQVQGLFMKHFKPLQSIVDANPDLLTKVTLQVDVETGRILGFETTRDSGVPAYDLAAERAVGAVPTIPLPPDKYLPEQDFPVTFNFRPQ